jgi:hypothetical protein
MGAPPGYPSEPPLGGTAQPPLVAPPWRTLAPAPEGPPPGGGRGPDDRRRWVILWSLVAVALLMATALSVVIVRTDDDGGGPLAAPGGSGAPSDPSVGSEHDTGGTPTDAEIEDLVTELSAFVEAERGLEFEQPVQLEIESDEAFHERLFDDFDEDAEATAAYEPLYQAAGLLEPGADLLETLRTALEGAVIGFYDPETEELVVRGTAITPAVRVTVAHELTHALDDQHFDLDREQYDEAQDEVSFGFSGLVEGSAVAVEEAYLATFTPEETDAYFEEQMSYGIPDVPFVLLELIGAPYQYGPGLVTALRADGGREALDAAFDEPPRTSEQVIHPEAYLDGEARARVDHPVADGEVAWEGVLGELFVQLVLGEKVAPDEAAAAAEGWGGDWATSWREDATSCFRAVFVGDTPADSDELYAAWSTWADAVEMTASAEQPAAGGPVTVTSCTGESSAGGGTGAA